ncbi:MAG: LuxR C-terminal-related transcriptional regulator [Aquihabitans sp.]
MEERDPGRAGWPVVGRDAELSCILGAPAGAAILVVAEPGTGLSSLLDEVERRLTANGRHAARVHGVDPAGPAYGAVAHLLSRPVPASADAVRSVAEDLAAHAGGGAILVDRVDRLDPASTAALRAVASGPTLVVAGGPAGRLEAWGDATRVDLAPLGADDLGALVETAVGGAVDGGIRADLVTRAGGDVALLHALVDGALAAGSLRLAAGVWSPAAPIVGGPEVRQLVADRLRALAPGELEAARLLALTGPLRIEVAAAIAGEDELEVLEELGVIGSEVDRAGRVRVALAVPVVAEVLAAEVPPLRRRRRCGEAVDALDALVAGGTAGRRDRMQAARLALEAGRDLTADTALDAAQDAWRSFDASLTERFATAALLGGAGFEAELLLARASAQLGDPAGADARLVALLASSEDDEHRVQATMVRSELLIFFQDDGEAAIAALEAVEPQITDPAGRVRLTAKRGLLLHSTGDPVGALHLLEPLLDQLDGDTLLLACFAVAVGATAVGRVGVALDACDRAEAAAPSGWDPMLVELSRLAALGLRGDVSDALSLSRRYYDDAVLNGARHRQGWFAWATGGLLLNQGHVADGARWCAASRSLLAGLGQRPAERLVANDLGRALAMLGRPDEAEAVLAATDEGDPGQRPGLFGDDEVRLVTNGWIAAARGDLPAARSLLTAAAQRYEARGHDYPALHAWVDVARLGAAAEVRDEVLRLAATVEGDLAEAQGELVAALASGDADALEAVGARLEGIGRDLFAAEALAAAAARLERAGEGRRASAAARRSAELVVRCGGMQIPTLRGADGPALSAREREVALLAANGRSNRQIAEQLILSVRTVETHLQRSYVKLGITRRDQLADVLGPGRAASA